MKLELKQLPKSEIELTVELDAPELEQYENEAARRISESVEIPGFRKGQAPKAFVIAQIGADGFFQETLNVALPRSYFEAVKEKNLQVISRPNVKVVSKNPLKYTAICAVLPEITIKSVEKIKVPEEPVNITEKEIDEVIHEMRRYRATYKPLTREVQKGDRLEIDFQGYDEASQPLEKTKSENHPLFLGEGTLVTGFEDQLLGMKTGEKKKFPVKFPKDFHYEPLKDKTVHFDVHLKLGEEPVLPELNEDFVSAVMGQKKTLPEMREALKSDLHARKSMEIRRKRENVLLEKLLDEAKLEVSPTLIEEEVDYMIEDLRRELESQKLKFEDYLEKLKKENRDIRHEYQKEGEKRIRVRLILNHLFRTLPIEVTDDEMALASQKLIERTPDNEKETLKKKLETKGEVYQRLRNNLMLEKLFVKCLGPI